MSFESQYATSYYFVISSNL